MKIIDAEVASRRQESRSVNESAGSAERRRYEELIRAEASGLGLDREDAAFMRYFEAGSEYQQHQAHFEGLRLQEVQARRRQQNDAI